MSKRVLFVHDGRILYDKQSDSYYGLHYNDRLVERYRYLGDKVSFLMRVNALSTNVVHGYERIVANDFQVIEIPNFKSVKSYLFNKPIAKKRISEAVANHDFVVVRLPSSAGVIAYYEALRQQKPVLVEVVACVYDALWNYDWRGKLLAHYRFFQYRRMMRTVPFALYVTEYFLQSRYPSKGKVYSCSDVDLIPQREQDLNNRLEKIRKYDPNEPIVLGTVAALDVPYKGQADVIKALGILKKRGISFKYRLVGQGDPSRLIKIIKINDVEELVEIVGPMPHAQIFEFMREIDVYIQPSHQEGLPRAMIEAMCLACPALGSTAGGISELIEAQCTFQPGSVYSIISRLGSVTTTWLLDQATFNYETSKKYQKKELDDRRKRVYDDFINHSHGQK